MDTAQEDQNSWREVLVHLKSGEQRRVMGAMQALHVLSEDWPPPFGPVYNRAKFCCERALDGRVSVGEARQAFFAAVFAAGMSSRTQVK